MIIFSDIVNNEVPKTTCIQHDTDFAGGDLLDPTNAWGVVNYKNIVDETKCQELCQKNDKCNYWTYGTTRVQRDYRKNCWLKSSDSGSKTNTGFKSGRKVCSKFTY